MKNIDLDYFNKCLQNTINSFILKSEYNVDELRANYTNKTLDFKLIYDLCIIINVPMMEFVERFEGELLK